MLRRIVLENFMSHARTVIEPAEGLTVLTGPNNCGKSAVVLALQILAYNPPGTDYVVRHGEREARVTVETADGHTVVWKRKGDVVSYEIDGRAVHRLGRGGVPDDLHRILRLPMVRPDEEGEHEFDIHFGEQKKPIFLLGDTERRAALFFASASDAALLLKMQERHREKVRDAREEKKRLDARVEALRKDLDVLSPVERIGETLERLESEHEAILEVGRRLARLEEECGALEKWEREREGNRAREGVLQALRAPPVLELERTLADLVADLVAVGAACEREAARAEALAALRGPPELEDAAGLEGLLDALRGEGAEAARARAAAGVLAALRPPPDSIDTAPAERLEREWEEAAKALAAAAKGELAAARELESARARLRQWAEQNPLCPVCGGPIDPARILEEKAHSHG